MSALAELKEQLRVVPPPQRAKALEKAREITRKKPWVPNPGPQTDAYFCLADVLLYGGEAGGGKSQLAIGIGVNEADRGIIFRRELTQTDGIEADGKSIIGKTAGFNGTDHEWTWFNGKSLKLGAMPEDDMAEAIQNLFHAQKKSVLIVTADADRHMGKRREIVEPDEEELPFDAGRDAPKPADPPADDSDLANAGGAAEDETAESDDEAEQ